MVLMIPSAIETLKIFQSSYNNGRKDEMAEREKSTRDSVFRKKTVVFMIKVFKTIHSLFNYKLG